MDTTIMVSIQIYINSLPVNTTSIDISHRGLKIMPDLSRFINLKELYCSNNQLTSLGTLNSSLIFLVCHHNQLTSIPTLPPDLKVLDCSYNQLTSIPILPPNLKVLNCSSNLLIYLPELNEKLKKISCFGNKLRCFPKLNENLKYFESDNNEICYILNLTDTIDIMRKKINILNKFRFLYYCLKFKSHFRNILWERIRKPKIEAKFNPSNLHLLLNKGCDFEEVLDKWGHDNETY
jgi:Leucine-rich repeat (LRR) protein